MSRCEYCKGQTFENMPLITREMHDFAISIPVVYLTKEPMNWQLMVQAPTILKAAVINFCPMCGRDLRKES